jgi:hypothetical protein
MNTSKKLPFWLRRVDVPVAGQVAAKSVTELNVPAIAKAALWPILMVALLFGTLHQVQRHAAIRDEIEEAHAQCVQLFGKAAKVIGAHYQADLHVEGVSVERFIDRGDGPDTLDCRANVRYRQDVYQWLATGHPGEPFMLVSAQVLGEQMVNEFPQEN